jgi:predicted SAM-dependent methyltransferase
MDKIIKHFFSKGHYFADKTIRNYYKNHDIIKIHIGCGEFIKPGWINADIQNGDIYLNAKTVFPFKTDSVDFIFNEQFLEHLTLGEAIHFSNESNRILKKGGVIRTSTPDLKKLIKFYQGTNIKAPKKKIFQKHFVLEKQPHHIFLNNHTLCEYINDYFRCWNHKFIYDFDTMKQIFFKAGFKKVYRVDFGKSHYSELIGIEEHGRNNDWSQDYISTSIEAIK